MKDTYELIVWGELKETVVNRENAEKRGLAIANENREPVVIKCGDKVLSECYDGKVVRFDETVDGYPYNCTDDFTDEDIAELERLADEEFADECGYNPYMGQCDFDC